VLSLGAGFVGGYFVHAWKSVEPSSADAALATTGKRQAPKSYERLVEEAGEQPAGVLDEDDARVICDEVPMDGLIGGRDTGPEPRLSDPDDAACVEARRSGDGLW
jgi:hypothetical protein